MWWARAAHLAHPVGWPSQQTMQYVGHGERTLGRLGTGLPSPLGGVGVTTGTAGDGDARGPHDDGMGWGPQGSLQDKG